MKTDEQIHEEVYSVFARMHPVEAFESDNEKFMRWMKKQGYDLTIKEVKEIIKDIE